jgi:NADH-quinone oxidoreductase subunit J
MIGAIVLTVRHRPGVHRQRISAQIGRKRGDVLAINQVSSGAGAPVETVKIPEVSLQ